MSDIVVFATTIVLFALALTAHVAIVYGLAWRVPRWRAGVALVIVPLAMYWAVRERMRVRAALWALGVVGYVVARVAARL